MATQLITSDAVVLAAIAAKILQQRRAAFAFEKFTHQARSRTMSEAAQQMWPRNAGMPITMLTDPFIENQRGTQKGGGYRYQMAQKIPYSGQGKSGDVQLHGSELSDTLRYMEGYINLKRQAGLEKIGDFNDQLQGAWARQLAAEVGDSLMEWLYYWKAWYGIPYSLLWGHSRHIVGTDSGDLSVTRRLNPNIYNCGLTPGTGAGTGTTYSTWSATHATHMQNIARNAIQVVNASQCYMSAEQLDILYNEALRLRIKPLNGDAASPIFGCLLHIDQFAQLKQDDRFLATQQEFEGNSEQSAMWKSMGAIKYSNLIIFPGLNGPCEVYPHLTTDTLTTFAGTSADVTDIVFGPVTDSAGLPEKDLLVPGNIDSDASSASSQEVAALRCGFILGGDCLYGVQTKAPRLVRDQWDYEARKGIAVSWMGGWSRCDWYNNPAPASATTVEHTGSIPFISYSPRRSSAI